MKSMWPPVGLFQSGPNPMARLPPGATRAQLVHERLRLGVVLEAVLREHEVELPLRARRLDAEDADAADVEHALAGELEPPAEALEEAGDGALGIARVDALRDVGRSPGRSRDEKALGDRHAGEDRRAARSDLKLGPRPAESSYRPARRPRWRRPLPWVHSLRPGGG